MPASTAQILHSFLKWFVSVEWHSTAQSKRSRDPALCLWQCCWFWYVYSANPSQCSMGLTSREWLGHGITLILLPRRRFVAPPVICCDSTYLRLGIVLLKLKPRSRSKEGKDELALQLHCNSPVQVASNSSSLRNECLPKQLYYPWRTCFGA